MSYVWVWPSFKNILFRGSHEHPTEQTKQTVNAKSSCQSQQRNANQSQARKHNIRKQSCRAKLQPTNQPTNQPQPNKSSEQSKADKSSEASKPTSKSSKDTKPHKASQQMGKPSKSSKLCNIVAKSVRDQARKAQFYQAKQIK